MTCRHFRALMWKNFLLKRRNAVSTCCECALPVGFVLLMTALYYAFSWNYFDTQSYAGGQWGLASIAAGVTPTVERAVPLSILPARLQRINNIIAIAAGSGADAATVAAAARFQADMTARYPEFNGTRYNLTSLSNVYIPGWSAVTRLFADEGEVEAYVKDNSYGLTSAPRIWGAIIFYKSGPDWNYAVRLNFTQVPLTNLEPVNTLQRGALLTNVALYSMPAPPVGGGPFSRASSTVNNQKMPGFLTLQLMVDRWIINRTTPVASMDPLAATSAFSYMLSFMLPNWPSALFDPNGFNAEIARLAVNDTARALTVTSNIRNWMAAEAYAPQQVDFVPFPIFSYQSNGFYAIASSVFAFFFVFAFLFPVSRLIRGIVAEKEAKIREGMRMMGLTDSALFGSWLVTYAILYFVIAFVIAIITASNMFRSTSPVIVFLLFFLFGLSSITYCYFVSVFFSRAKTASILGVVLFLATFFPWFAVNPADYSYASKTAASLLSTTAFGLALDTLSAFEDAGVGINGSNLTTVQRNYSMATGLGMMFLDFIIYGILAWYADGVLPASFREFGVPRPWNFPFTAEYWREVLNIMDKRGNTHEGASLMPSNASPADGGADKTRATLFWRLWTAVTCSRATPFTTGPRIHNGVTDPSFIEEVDSSFKGKERDNKCISIRKLRKEFDTPDGIKVAVDDIDLTMYEGQIFVLLGHNGAGKSTTINMLTGMLEPTDGSMHALGHDLSHELAAVRRDLGVCPQHDVLWPELTVMEHLQLYSSIKGLDPARVPTEITKIIREVGLTEKVNYASSQLSGGQKRKLSVAIALIGGSRVVFLDEPTSGMDPYSRRSTWQVLENARADRIIILTTHFMDEADILGDRIAIMANGVVKCCGSPMFLKRRYGVGYLLSCVKAPTCVSSRVVALLRTYIPEVSVSTDVGAELVLRLPMNASHVFPAMFADIDVHANSLGIVSYGIGITTMEEVFLKVAHGDAVDAPVTSPIAAPDAQSMSSASSGARASTDLALTDVDAESGHASAASHPSAVTPAQVKVSGVDAGTGTPLPSSNGAAGNGAATNGTSAVKMQRSSSSSAAPSRAHTREGGLAAVRAAARSSDTSLHMHWTHFRALFIKRAAISRRDFKGVCYQLLIPALIVVVGLGLLVSTAITGYPRYTFSVNNFNVNARTGTGGPQYPNLVPFFTFKSEAASVDEPSITSLFASIPQSIAATGTPAMILNTTRAYNVGDPYKVITTGSLPAADQQRMSSFLLQDARNYAASKYGAYVLTRNSTLFPGQPLTATAPTSNLVTYAVMHNTTAIHGAPVFMNIMNSALAAAYNNMTITTSTYPLPFTKRQATVYAAVFSFVSATIIVMAFAFIPASYAISIVKEREVSAKHQQLISGVSVWAYWLSTFAWDFASYLIPCFLTVFIVLGYGIAEFTSPDRSRIGAFIVVLLLYGSSSAGFTYCLSYLFKSHSTAQNVILFINVACMILMIASFIMSQIDTTCYADRRLKYIYRFLPGFSLGNSFIQLSFLDLLPILDAQCDNLNGVRVNLADIAPYNAFDMRATGTNLIYMGIESIAYLLLAIGIDVALSHPRIRLLFSRDAVVADTAFVEDDDVQAERTRVADEVRASAGQVDAFTDVILLDNLRKVYQTGKVAVKGMSFGVPVGQVFGFLGINGAGKTTTLQMLSGDVLPSSGSARLAGFDIISQQPQVRRLLGYCPQWDALLELLTTREHLELYARIKGVEEASVPHTVDELLKRMDLTSFSNKKAGTLSGGNKRKLSVAIAMIASPPLIFLDEPSTGMDPVARRFMWDVITRIATKDQLCSIILTTHSMEECEALAQRVGIMVGGRLRCLGSVQHLKNKYGSGYMTEIKLDEPGPARVDAIVTSMRAAMRAGPEVGFISRAQVHAVAEALNNLPREAQIVDSGSGWAIAAAFAHSEVPSSTLPAGHPDKCIPIMDLATWWAGEDMARNLAAYISGEAFPGAELLERHGTQMRFKLPPQAEPLGVLFSKIEYMKESLGIKSYSLGQTSLEQIFNYFASQQEEERGMARGMGSQPAAGAAAVAVPAGPGGHAAAAIENGGR